MGEEQTTFSDIFSTVFNMLTVLKFFELWKSLARPIQATEFECVFF